MNTILARLRRVLGPDALGARGQLMLALDEMSWIDVEVAEHGADTAGKLLEQPSPAAPGLMPPKPWT